jgi:diguanylate cyclase (GGDEF)-like protein
VANISVVDDYLYWSIHLAAKRDKLYQELIDTRDALEDKTQTLHHLTRTDALTSLYNRRAILFDLNSIMEHSKVLHVHVPVAFLMIDIDFFKQINDKYGHDTGDDVLKAVSKTLLECIDSEDLVARWGGEEFLIIRYSSELEQTQQFCKKLHEKISHIINHQKPITVSIGVAQTNTACGNVEAVIKQADVALYKAKDSGRNRTEFLSYLDV